MTKRRTGGTSAFNTRTVGRDVSSFLIHQHDGVVVVELQYSGRASPSTYGGGEVLGWEREAPRAWVQLPSLPPLYIGPLVGGAGTRRWLSKGAAAKGGT